MEYTPRIRKKMEQIDTFLKNYQEGEELQIYMSTTDKKVLEEYVHNHPNGSKDFCFLVGVHKAGFLEIDFRLRKRVNQ